MITRYLRLSSQAEVLAFVREYWSEIETFEKCRVVEGRISLDRTDPAAETRRAIIAMPTYQGVLGGAPDNDADAVERSYTDEGGNLVTWTEQPLKLQANGEPYMHVNVGWEGSEEELLLVATVDLAAAVVQPEKPFSCFAASNGR